MMQEIFDCKQCGECCKGFGGTIVKEKDIKAIASYLEINVENFVKEYCVRSGLGLVLAQNENGYCILWENKLCKIHPVKPKMCRKWPFIDSLLKDFSNWQIMASNCAGINPNAPYDKVCQFI